jgi:predicted phosphoadenosine phosphosulfate sulfurtransferase
MNVFEAAIARVSFLFDEFEQIVVSFSGGKDSGVMLNLALMEARKRKRKIGLMHLDYEAEYQSTDQYVTETIKDNLDVLDVYRCCVPFKVTTCTSMHQSYWRPWDPKQQSNWVKPLPEFAVRDFPFFKPNMWDYEFQEAFGLWIAGKKKTALLIGIRTQESMDRWRAIFKERESYYSGKRWTKQVGDNVFNAYPIYDWTTSDVWIANAKMKWKYNPLYDLMHQAGVPVEKMRVASPFISAAQDSLKLYRAIEPDTWAKLIGRVNGVNFTGIYGGTTAMGWHTITKPPGHTWESYMHFLLKTLPEKTRRGYLEKLSTSIKFWKEKGGVLPAETIEKLKAAGVKFTVGKSSNYNTSKLPVRMEYLDEIDIAEAKDIPTFKRMCICIMKNDHLCKYMGFTLTKNELARRKNVIEKYQNLL